VTEAGDDALANKAARHLWMHFTRHSTYEQGGHVPVIVKGEGARIWDDDGRQYLDGLAGLFVVQVGHGRAELAAAAAKQAQELAFFPIWSYAHPAAIELAERLAHLAPGDLNRVFFTNGGGDAVESAWKLAKQYFKLTGKPMKTKVISRNVATGLRRAPSASPGSRRQGVLRTPRCQEPSGANTTTGHRSTATISAFSIWAADQIELAIGWRANTVAAVFLGRCRTRVAASRRRPATSSACARSATSTT
jgi:adenosylmethionine-8-amino-7-oxononanoate aminotransferase